MCRRTSGAAFVSWMAIPVTSFKFNKGEPKKLVSSDHGTRYFCKECGIYTHHNPRSAPAMTGFNLGCVDEVKVEDLKDVAFFDGLNHPMDQKK